MIYQFLVNASWAAGNFSNTMRWENHRGDRKTLNLLYVIDSFERSPHYSGLSTWPDTLELDLNAVRLDAYTVISATVPGSPVHDPKWQCKTAVRGVGQWLGLLPTGESNCTTEQDMVDDTPIALKNKMHGCPIGQDSCPNQPGKDTIHNFMSSTDDHCKTEFTAGQTRRMHEMWKKYRELMVSTRPIAQNEKQWYPQSSNPLTALTLCTPDQNGVYKETDEVACGSFVYCYFGAWKAAGEKYADWHQCINAHPVPDDEEEAQKHRRRDEGSSWWEREACGILTNFIFLTDTSTM